MGDITAVNLSKCCRLCLSVTADGMKSIFDDANNTNEVGLQQKISVLLNVQISANDTLSTMVCPECLEKINSWQVFKSKCYENQIRLELWGNTTNLGILETNVEIKNEPLDQQVPDIVNEEEILVKTEPQDEYDDLPPPLTPQRLDVTINEENEEMINERSSQDNNNTKLDPCKCTICGKIFSSLGNRKKHEKNMHKTPNHHNSTESAHKPSQNKRVRTPLSPQPPILTQMTPISDAKRKPVNKSIFQNNKNKEPSDSSFYSCPECDGIFNSTEWTKHKETHEKKKCNQCGKVFQFQSELAEHSKIHSSPESDKPYKGTRSSSSGKNKITSFCEICDRIFSSKEELNDHRLTHEIMPILEPMEQDDKNTKKFSCNLCDKHYLRRGGLWAHNKKNHPQNKLSPTKSRNTESYHACERCFKVFASKNNLKKHMESHTRASPENKPLKGGPKKVWCNICHSSFESASKLKQHKARRHADLDKMPVLYDEQNTKNVKVPFIFTCDNCCKTFTSRIALNKHKEKNHSKVVKTKTKNGELEVYCKYCKITFANPNQLSNHKKYEHAEEKKRKSVKKRSTFSCELCGKSFPTISGYYGHQGWHKRGKNNTNNIKKTVEDSVKGKIVKEKVHTPKIQRPTVNPVPANKKPPQLQVSDKRENETKIHTPKIQPLTVNPVPAKKKTPQLQVSDKRENETKIHTPKIQPPSVNPVPAKKKTPQMQVSDKRENVNTSKRCTMCNIDFHSLDEYEKHNQFHILIKTQTKILSCTHCSATFSKSDSLKTHMLRVHRAQEFKCSQCGRVFDKENSLNIHLKVHEKQKIVTGSKVQNKPLYSCSICKKGYDLPKDLRTHTLEEHPF